jgi:hypothetical protein
LLALVTGNTIEVSWSAPVSGGAVLDYLIEVGTQPGLTNIGVNTTASSIVTYTNAPAGTYFVRVRARNQAGTGPASDTVRVDVA